MQTPQEMLDELITRFQPSAAEGLSAIYQLNLSGEGGGIWHMTVADQQCLLASGPASQADVIIGMTAIDWANLLAKTLDAYTAYFSGRLQIEGDMGLVMRLQALFSF
jgi:putative sterol carrier protein